MAALTRNQVAAKTLAQAGYTGNPKDGAALDKWKAQSGNAAKWKELTNQAMVAPVTPALEEPLHEWEKTGLTALSKGVDTSQMQGALSQLQGLLGNNGMLERATASVNPNEVATMQNPYSQSLKDKLSTSAQQIRAAATSQQGLRGGRSFGDTATGVQMGMIDQGQLQGEADIDYQTWQDSLGQINNERNRLLSGAGLGVAGAQTQYNMADGIGQQGVQNALGQMQAGNYVRGYNQNLNDIVKSELLAKQGDPLARLQNSLGLTGAFSGSTSSGQSGGMANNMQQFGGLMQGLGGSGLFS